MEVFAWFVAALALTVNTELGLGDAYQVVCKKSGGEWHNPVPAELQDRYGKANAGCYYV